MLLNAILNAKHNCSAILGMSTLMYIPTELNGMDSQVTVYMSAV